MRYLSTSMILLAACGGASPAAVSSGGGGGAVAAPSIRSVDWANRTYAGGGSGAVTVHDGEAEIVFDPAIPEERGWFQVSPPQYGDVDGDGVEDAVVITTFNGGGTGMFDEAEVYVMRPGASEPVKIGSVPGGDRGDGGLAEVRVDGGRILVDRMTSTDQDGACCPSKLTKEVWRWDGAAFVEDVAARQVVDNPEAQR